MVVVAVAAGVWFGASSTTSAVPSALPAAAPPPGEAAVALLTVHVGGEVLRPGLVEVPDGARVADVVAAAGGATRSAQLTAVNLAQTVRDGEQVIIPGLEDEGTGGTGPGDGLVAINTAPSEELQQLPGVGPVLAERIVHHRQTSGPFESVDDLLDVPGIGENKLASLRDLVKVP